jgi:hypothetical protein
MGAILERRNPKRNWFRESCKEISIATKNILKVKDVFIAAQFILMVIGLCFHLNDRKQLKSTQKQSDNYRHQRDSLRVESINRRYGN